MILFFQVVAEESSRELMSQMYESLEKLKKLPSNTLVYSAHEYTLANLEFARHVEQSNQDISEYIDICEQTD